MKACHSRQLQLIRSVIAAAGSALLAISAADAQTVWDGSESGSWANGDNWVGGVAPPTPAGGSLTFSGTANQTNTNDAGITSIGTLTLSNGGWDIDLGSLSNTSGIGSINATGSSILRGNFGMGNGASKTITLNGTGNTLTIADKLTIYRANSSMNLQVNGAGNTLVLGSLDLQAGNANKTISGTANVTVNGAVTENINLGDFVKDGTGTLTLNGSYTSNNATIVNGGTLLINGNSSAATGAFTVGTSGTLGGTGTVGGATTINGTLRPGQSVGTFTFADSLTLTTTAATFMEIDGNAGAGAIGGHDFIDLTGAGAAGLLIYDGALTLDIGTLFSAGNYSWDLFDFDGEAGTLASITLADQYSGSLLDGDADGVWDLISGTETWSFNESTGVLNLTIVPEPGTLLLGSFGMLLLLRRRRELT